jgi:hypothetical protein
MPDPRENGTLRVPFFLPHRVNEVRGNRRAGSRYFFASACFASAAAPGVTVSSDSHLPPFTT